jgi:FHA domain-containing protein
MTLSKKARSAEAKVGHAIDAIVGRLVGTEPRQPLEVLLALVEHVERQVQPAARGTWTFPFNRLTVEFAVPTREAKARLAAVVGDAESLRARIAEALRPSCRVGPLDVRIRYRAQGANDWTTPEFHVVCERVDVPAPRDAPRPVAAPSLELTVAHGTVDRRRFSVTGGRIDIGRGTEVLDSAQRLVRRNGIAFSEGGGDVNQTVSRRHAHVLYRAASREYRVYDDNSARGTHIVRNGVTIPVPPGTRGVRLQSGDELTLGQARLRVKIGPQERRSAAL